MALTAMPLLALALLGTWGPGPASAPSSQEDAGWPALWTRLEALDAGAGTPDPQALADLQDALAARRAHAAADPRTALLAAHVERLTGGTPGLGLPPDEPWPFDERESWLAARVAAPGPPLVRAVLAALERSAAPPSLAHLLLAWNATVSEAGALRLAEGALPIQAALHERYRAAWSAIDLSLTTSWLGRTAEADALLAEAIELEGAAGRPTGDLWSRRGLVALGVGKVAEARENLLRGRARGSSDAAQILAKLALDEGDRATARRGFRALLRAEPAVAWARRGWGLTLLPSTGRDAPESTPSR